MKYHAVDVVDLETRALQAEFDRLLRKCRVALDAGEAFLLSGGDDFAIDDEGGGGVVIKSVDSENVHGEKRVSERSSGMILTINNKKSC